MSNTLRNYKGAKYPEKTRRKHAPKKWFGFTEGNHTDRHYIQGSTRFEDGTLVQDFETRPPIKGKDFIKRGYPDGGYPKHIYKGKRKGYYVEEDI